MNEMHSRQIDVTFPSYLDMPFAFTYPIKLSKPSFLNYGFGWFIHEYRGKTLFIMVVILMVRDVKLVLSPT